MRIYISPLDISTLIYANLNYVKVSIMIKQWVEKKDGSSNRWLGQSPMV